MSCFDCSDLPVGPTAKIRSVGAAEQLGVKLTEVGAAIGLNVRLHVSDGRQPVRKAAESDPRSKRAMCSQYSRARRPRRSTCASARWIWRACCWSSTEWQDGCGPRARATSARRWQCGAQVRGHLRRAGWPARTADGAAGTPATITAAQRRNRVGGRQSPVESSRQTRRRAARSGHPDSNCTRTSAMWSRAAIRS